MGFGLLAALDWLLRSVESIERSETIEFVPSNSRNQLTYNEAREALVTALRRDASLHDASRFSDLGDGYDDLEERFPRDAGPQSANLVLALNFWSAWLNASEHGWSFQEPFRAHDWPVLARRIADALESGRDINDSLLVRKFSRRARLLRLFATTAVIILIFLFVSRR